MTETDNINFPVVSVGAIGGASIQTVDARDLHAFLEVKSQFRDWIKNRVEDFGFVENEDFVTAIEIYRGGERKDYHLSLDMAKELSMVERNAKGKQARQYFIDCERRAKLVTDLLPNFSDPVAAARAWANEREARTIAERTKAEIGNRREATAMNTASQAVKKAKAIAQELDRSRSYASVKRMSMNYHGQEFEWRLLKQVSSEIGKPPIDVFDANYGTVKAYHADAWREAYALDIPTTDSERRVTGETV